ncbi:fungal-specific transcription factor domain-containing protein [Dactylonectria macrodidyma]|uniref:Fungal-specific transcription factor domain-containing protein n=1 Tax=Dactylonectria macrodidyma TaxID=307937 RepID=A0A9P9IZP6_9HYPO|nr:fungal-specific transcription factor domain-containing protein [Dactylonectria macrodidyma]
MSPRSQGGDDEPSAGSVTSTRRVSKSTSSARSRPRASMACLNCRQKKTKCDVQSLESGKGCTLCRNTNIECITVPNGDRRKHGSREYISALQGRMESIEALISQCGINLDDVAGCAGVAEVDMEPPIDTSVIEIPPPSGSETSKSVGDGNNAELTNQRTPMSLPSVHGEPEAGGGKSPAEIQVMDETQEADHQVPTALMDPYLSAACEDFHDRIYNPTAEHEVPEHRHSSLDDSGPNLDTDSSPGQLRYYGPTTQLHIQARHTQDTDMLVNLGSTTSFVVDMDSTRLRETLIESCWGYYSRSVSVVDEQLFKAHRALGKRSQYYSRFLEAAFLACATRVSTSHAVRSLGRAYANQAKEDIVLELEQPTIATLQGFLLLSDFEATSARDRIGWTYSGIACRLIFDLGLHEECSQLVKHGILIQADADLRHQLFLTAFVYDRLWALYLGRPSCVPLVSVEQRLSCKGPTRLSRSLDHWVILCKLISEVTDKLNGFGTVLDDGSAEHLWELSERISAAHDRLPPSLSPKHISELEMTAYGLNIQFYGIQIVLHRAIVKVLSQSTDKRANHDRTTQVEKSRQALYDNAAHVCRLILAYREIYGVEKFITVMLDNMYVTASTLIAYILQPPAVHSRQGVIESNASQLLNIIAETMSALQKHYPVAEKMRQTLSRITENTVLAGSFGPIEARSSTSQSLDTVLSDAFVPVMVGSWGSMEALVHDDFILSQSQLLGSSAHVDELVVSAPWIQDLGIGSMP